jgi:hypothetical protein
LSDLNLNSVSRKPNGNVKLPDINPNCKYCCDMNLPPDCSKKIDSDSKQICERDIATNADNINHDIGMNNVDSTLKRLKDRYSIVNEQKSTLKRLENLLNRNLQWLILKCFGLENMKFLDVDPIFIDFFYMIFPLPDCCFLERNIAIISDNINHNIDIVIEQDVDLSVDCCLDVIFPPN